MNGQTNSDAYPIVVRVALANVIDGNAKWKACRGGRQVLTLLLAVRMRGTPRVASAVPAPRCAAYLAGLL